MAQWYTFFLVFLVLIIPGCDRTSPDYAMAEYHKRLANSIDRDAIKASPVQVNPYPAKRKLKLALQPDSSIALTDLLALDICKLGQVIAQRNSALGKVSSASAELVYTLNFLELAPECIEQMQKDGRPDLAGKLQQTLAEKKYNLSQSIWQGTLGEEEFREFWSLSVSLGNYPEKTSFTVIEAINRIKTWSSDWLQGDYQVDPGELTAVLNDIRRGDGGQLLIALTQQADMLDRNNRLLQSRLGDQPLCREDASNQRGKVLWNVVQRFWLQDLQPWSAAVNRRYYELHSAIQELEEHLSAGEPEAYKEWRLQRYKTLQEKSIAPAKHIDYLQTLFEQCGLAVSGEG